MAMYRDDMPINDSRAGLADERALRLINGWSYHSRVAPPGLQGVLRLFTWIFAVHEMNRLDQCEGPEARHHHRLFVARYLMLNGVSQEEAWTFVGGWG